MGSLRNQNNKDIGSMSENIPERQKWFDQGLIKEYNIPSFFGLINAWIDLRKNLQIYDRNNK